jgi:hypothetical protein
MACLTPALVSLSTKSSPQDLERAQGNSCGKLLQGFPYERRMPHRNFLGRETALEFSLYPRWPADPNERRKSPRLLQSIFRTEPASRRQLLPVSDPQGRERPECREP